MTTLKMLFTSSKFEEAIQYAKTHLYELQDGLEVCHLVRYALSAVKLNKDALFGVQFGNIELVNFLMDHDFPLVEEVLHHNWKGFESHLVEWKGGYYFHGALMAMRRICERSDGREHILLLQRLFAKEYSYYVRFDSSIESANSVFMKMIHVNPWILQYSPKLRSHYDVLNMKS